MKYTIEFRNNWVTSTLLQGKLDLQGHKLKEGEKNNTKAQYANM